MKPTDTELNKRFSFSPARNNAEQKAYLHLDVRFEEFAKELRDFVPDERCLELALTKLEEARFWSKHGIARGE